SRFRQPQIDCTVEAPHERAVDNRPIDTVEHVEADPDTDVAVADVDAVNVKESGFSVDSILSRFDAAIERLQAQVEPETEPEPDVKTEPDVEPGPSEPGDPDIELPVVPELEAALDAEPQAELSSKAE